MKFEKRTVAFFQIVNHMAKRMEKVVKIYRKKQINWPDIPGYVNIIKAFLMEMKELEINEYPDSLIEATHSLLSNP